MPRYTTRGYLFLAAAVVIAVLVATDLSHRNGSAESPALTAVQTSVNGIYMIPNIPSGSSVDQFPLGLEQFLKEHPDQDCVFVGDYLIGKTVQGHFFRCTCRVPDPCENGAIPAQEITRE